MKQDPHGPHGPDDKENERQGLDQRPGSPTTPPMAASWSLAEIRQSTKRQP